MATIAPTILRPNVTNKVVSDLEVTNNRLQNFWGMGIGGGNVSQQHGRNFAWDVFNDSREVATGRSPGAATATIKPQKIGEVTGTFPRSAESLHLAYERIHNQRQIGQPGSSIDTAGEGYILRQSGYVSQRQSNFREFQIAAMMRDQYYFAISGDDLNNSFTTTGIQINYQVPAGNKSQLQMDGVNTILGTKWPTASAPIIGDLFAINGAFEELVGMGLTDAFLTSVGWGNIIANTEVQNLAGSSNRPFEVIERVAGTTDFTARLHAAPWVTFHITDGGVDLNGTFTKLFEDTGCALVAGGGGPLVADYLEGSEVVVDYDGAPPHVEFGTHFWTTPKNNPAGYDMNAITNGIPALYRPKAIAYATTDF